MFYSPKKFYDSMPEWKRKKDNIFCKLIYRPLSYLLSSVCSIFGVSANAVSYFSLLIAIVACVFIATPYLALRIIGAGLVNFWLVLDCTDGNLARCIKKQPYGEFADSISSYVLVGFLWTALGVACYFDGGVVFEKKDIVPILIGCISSSSDTMMRLVYQKYRSVTFEYEINGLLIKQKDFVKDKNAVNTIFSKVNATLGIGGFLPLMILLCVIFHSLDIVLFYACFYYVGSFLVTFMMFIYKSVKNSKEIEKNSQKMVEQ